MLLFKRIVAVGFIVVAAYGHISAQVKRIPASAKELKATSEKILGQDDLLVNGIGYVPEYTKVTGSPEFELTGHTKSVLFIKGQRFEDIRLAYDIVSDKVLLVQEYGKGLENRIEMYRSFVDSFIIGDHLFINPANTIGSLTSSGYYEKVSSGRIMFLKKYRKTFVSIYDNQNRGKYSPQQYRIYLVNRSGTMVPVSSNGAFLNYFSVHKKSIRNFMSENDISLKSADNNEIRQLMFYCNSLADEIH